MKKQHTDSIIRRVAIALDASGQSSQALQAAAELAASLQAELEGIFIEDINLIRLAELPFTREIRPASMTEEVVDLQRMEQELRSQARQQQQKLELIAREKGISCSFSTRRGHIKAELMQTAAEVDFLTFCSPDQRSDRLKTKTIDNAVSWSQAKPSITVIFGNPQDGNGMLMAAARLAERLAMDLTVLLTGETDEDTKDMQRAARSILADEKLVANFIPLPACQVSDLIIATDSANSRLLLVNSNNPVVSGGELWHYLEQISCPVLIVRDQSATSRG